MLVGNRRMFGEPGFCEVAFGFLSFYLSSVSMMYQATGDKELLKRLQYVLNELELCQKAGRDRFLLGIKDGRKLFGEVASGRIKNE